MSEYYSIAPYSSELYHHGIKGQKWGVRRFQNADGSLTAAGKRRAAKQEIKSIKKTIQQTREGTMVDYAKAREHVQKAAVYVGKEQANKMLKSEFGKMKASTAAGAVGLTAGVAAANAALFATGYYSVHLVAALPLSAIGGVHAYANNSRALDEIRNDIKL